MIGDSKQVGCGVDRRNVHKRTSLILDQAPVT